MLSIPLHVPAALIFAAASLLGPTARAATPTAGSAPGRTISVELEESGGKAGTQHVRFVVPIGGEIKAWVRGGDDPRFCHVRAHLAGSSADLSLDLSCARGKASAADLEVKATRAFPAGKSIVVGQVSRPDGSTIVVRAKL